MEEEYYMISSVVVAPAGDFPHISFLAATDGKLWETGAVADYIVFLLEVVFVTGMFTGSELNVLSLAAVLAMVFKSLQLLPLAPLQLAAHLLLWFFEILFWGRLLAATRWVRALKARVVVLIVGIFLIGGTVAAFRLDSLSLGLFAYATFFHLVFVTVFILVEALPERLFLLALLVSDSVFIKQALDLTCCLTMVAHWTSCTVFNFCLIMIFLQFYLFLLVYFLLVDILLVILWTSLGRVMDFCKDFRRESKGGSNLSVV